MGKIRVAVFHQGALGDFLIAASAIDELGQDPALERIDFWSKPEHVVLLTGKSYLGKCYSPDGPLAGSLLHDTMWRSATLPDFLIEAAQVFIFGQTGSRLMAERLSVRLSANVNWIQSFPVDQDSAHVSEFLRLQLNGLGWPIRGNPLTLSPPVSEKKAAKDLLQFIAGNACKPVFIHPGSGGRHKVWPLRNWHGLIDWLRRELSLQVLLSIGPADEYVDGFSMAMREAGVPIVSGLSASRLCALLSLCGLYIGSDSGVSHLAAAVGIPVVAVFGPTDPRVWAPLGKSAVALRRQWKDEDVLRWAPSEKPDFQDKEIAGLVTDLYRFLC